MSSELGLAMGSSRKGNNSLHVQVQWLTAVDSLCMCGKLNAHIVGSATMSYELSRLLVACSFTSIDGLFVR